MTTASPHAGRRTAPVLPGLLTAGLWTAAIVFAVLHSWPYRYRLVNLDAVSYLDLADAWRAGEWRDGINGYWSPAYSWVLAAAMAIVDPAPRNEYVLLHGVNVVLYVVALAAFWMLLRELLRDLPADGMSFPPATLATISTMLMIWIAITQIVVWMESPDLIPAAATFAASALLLRLRRHPSLRDASFLGAVLGVGYLGKAAMFPVAFVFLLTAAVVVKGARAMIVVAAVVSFGAVSGPWIAALSVAKGRATFGDAGRINYLYFVNRSENWPAHWPHWDGIEGRGQQTHAARRLLGEPAVYEFATPLSATYPMWYDPSHWNAGVSPEFDPRDQLRRLKLSASDYVTLFTVNFYNRSFFNPQPALAALLLVLWLARPPPRLRWTPAWVLIVPSVAALALYAAVYVEPRYVGASVLVIWLAVLAGVRMPEGADTARLVRGVSTTMAIVLAFAIVAPTVSEGASGWRRMLRGDPDESNHPWHIAGVLSQAGITAGTPVGIIGYAQGASRWARLGRVRIVAEMPPGDVWRFASAEPEEAAEVVAAFARTPARFLLAEQVPPGAASAGWAQLESTPYWMLRLR